MADLNQIAESLSSLTVMQAAELVKLLEQKWGVSAAAPVAVAAGPADGRPAGAGVFGSGRAEGCFRQSPDVLRARERSLTWRPRSRTISVLARTSRRSRRSSTSRT